MILRQSVLTAYPQPMPISRRETLPDASINQATVEAGARRARREGLYM
jgi:hypothetical protein